MPVKKINKVKKLKQKQKQKQSQKVNQNVTVNINTSKKSGGKKSSNKRQIVKVPTILPNNYNIPSLIVERPTTRYNPILNDPQQIGIQNALIKGIKLQEEEPKNVLLESVKSEEPLKNALLESIKSEEPTLLYENIYPNKSSTIDVNSSDINYNYNPLNNKSFFSDIVSDGEDSYGSQIDLNAKAFKRNLSKRRKKM